MRISDWSSDVCSSDLDEYGGSLDNRVRLIREILTDTKEAVGDRCGVAFRFAVDELRGEAGITSEGEGRDVVAMLAELPDLWDVNVSTWMNDSQTARFAEEGYQEPNKIGRASCRERGG